MPPPLSATSEGDFGNQVRLKGLSNKLNGWTGPVVAAIPALLIALTEGWQPALWTLFLYVAIQQVESNVIAPVVQIRDHFIVPLRKSSTIAPLPR